MRKLSLTINEKNEGKLIKNVLKNDFNMSTRLIDSIKKNGSFLLNGNNEFINKELRTGDFLEIYLPSGKSENIVPTKMNIKIMYEDEDILIVDKPSGMLVHPCQADYSNTLANGVVHYFISKNIKNCIFRPVNRLDRDTSGLIIIAKNQYANQQLAIQREDKKLVRKYIAYVKGKFKDKEGLINFPIGRKEGSIIERCVCDNGDNALTNYKVLKVYNKFSILELSLETGRTHQIRVHLQYVGHPLLGDWLYGEESTLIGRQALHSYLIDFYHPVTQERLKVISKLPLDMKKIISKGK
jgi:23S rRNA pseudouridine1911/1915/1917 synthase